jgi:hypothetical protein
MWGKLKSALYANTPHNLEALKQNIREAIYTTFSNVYCNKSPEICLKEFRHVSQQRVDI